MIASESRRSRPPLHAGTTLLRAVKAAATGAFAPQRQGPPLSHPPDVRLTWSLSACTATPSASHRAGTTPSRRGALARAPAAAAATVTVADPTTVTVTAAAATRAPAAGGGRDRAAAPAPASAARARATSEPLPPRPSPPPPRNSNRCEWREMARHLQPIALGGVKRGSHPSAFANTQGSAQDVSVASFPRIALVDRAGQGPGSPAHTLTAPLRERAGVDVAMTGCA
jgi:hypothetical protein